MNDFIVKDDGDLRKYYAQIPNIVDDMNLSISAYRLYGHLKRVAGESGACWQSADALSKCCNMSHGSVTKSKQELLANNLITIENKPSKKGKNYHFITLTDIWFQNIEKYKTPAHEVIINPIKPPDGFINPIKPPDGLKNNQLLESITSTVTDSLLITDSKTENSTFTEKESPFIKPLVSAECDETSQDLDDYIIPKNLPPAPIRQITKGEEIVYKYFNGKRWLNDIQRELVNSMWDTYGSDKMDGYCKWAALNGLGRGKAINGMTNGLKNWGKRNGKVVVNKKDSLDTAYNNAINYLSMGALSNDAIIDSELVV